MDTDKVIPFLKSREDWRVFFAMLKTLMKAGANFKSRPVNIWPKDDYSTFVWEYTDELE